MCATAVGPPETDVEHDRVMRLRLSHVRGDASGGTYACSSEDVGYALQAVWSGREALSNGVVAPHRQMLSLLAASQATPSTRCPLCPSCMRRSSLR